MSPMLTYLLLIALWILIGTVIEAAITSGFDKNEISSPKVLYDNSKMNWFGCWICYILIRIISPLITGCLLVFFSFYYIFCFIRWLFTLGRKDEE